MEYPTAKAARKNTASPAARAYCCRNALLGAGKLHGF